MALNLAVRADVGRHVDEPAFATVITEHFFIPSALRGAGNLSPVCLVRLSNAELDHRGCESLVVSVFGVAIDFLPPAA